MKKQITCISPHQTAKVIAAFYGIFTLLLVPVGIAILVLGGKARLGGVFFIFAPVLYTALGYLFTVFFSWIYNQIALRIGGIEFEVRETGG